MSVLGNMIEMAAQENARMKTRKGGPGRPRCPRVADRRQRVYERAQDGLTYHAIASEMGLTLSTVKSDMSKTRLTIPDEAK